ncbi:hemagglutinin repeat-containing protein [Pseudomonas idahonensis]
MDVRQLAFLARQPSAALQSRDSFWGLPKRGLAFILANMMFWQPLVVMADGIVVNGSGTSLGQAGNGVPIVNIAAPNGGGLSHNQFSDYNVGQQGVILNNAINRTQETQLGGIILGNPNLGGRAANVILNEVNGGSPSQLKGYTEVAGQSAHVIVANPYGVSCNGCGFINTPKATLTTGKPVIENGQLQRYQVDQGSVAIEGAGLNASNIDQFEIITRSAKINAEIQAKHLAVIAGANDVDAKTLNATARTANPADAPQLAIDSSALGGMYAGAIKLVGTEAGVGVKLDGKLIASGGDIQLDANGQLRMVEASAEKGAVAIKTGSLDAQGAVYAGTDLKIDTQDNLINQKTLAAGDSISLSSGGQLSNHGIIEAGVNADNSRNQRGNVTLNAQNLNNSGKSVVASRDLTVTTTQTLNNQGGTLSAGRSANLRAETLDNQNQGRVLSSGSADLVVSQLSNAQGGLVNSHEHLKVQVANLNNQGGQLTSLKTLELKAGQVDNSNAGRIASNQALSASVTGLDQRNGGRLTSVGQLSLDLNNGHLNNQGGLIRGPSLVLKDLADVSNQGGEISSEQGFTLNARSLDNGGGKLLSDQALVLRLDQALSNVQGVISANGLTARVSALDNQSGTFTSQSDLSLSVDGALNNNLGEVSSGAVAQLHAASLDNSHSGKVIGDGGLTARITGLLDNRSKGQISAKGAMDLETGSFDNRDGLLSGKDLLTLTAARLDNRSGEVRADRTVQLNIEEVSNQEGKITGVAGVNVTATHLDNSGGKVLSGTDLGLKVAQVINQNKGLLFSQGKLTLQGQRLDNRDGKLSGQQGLNLLLSGELDNTRGGLRSDGGIDLTAKDINNSAGQVFSNDAIKLTSRGALNNQTGSISADQGLNLSSAHLDNRQGKISANGAMRLNTGAFDNTQGGHLTGKDSLDLKAEQVSNGTDSLIASDHALTASVTGLDQQGGRLFSKTSLSLDLNHGQLNNQQGLINGPLLMLKNLNGVNNQSGEISSAQAFTLAANNLDNSAGKLISTQALTLRIDKALANVKGHISAAALQVHSASLDNRTGMLSSRGVTGVAVDGELLNQGGTLVGDGVTRLSAASLDNAEGKVSGKSDLVIEVAQINNRKGLLISQGTLQLDGSTLDNQSSGLVSATQGIQLKVGDIDNRGGEISSKAAISLESQQLNNSDGARVVAGQALNLTIDQVLNRNKGELRAQSGLSLSASKLDNSAGSLISEKDLDLDLRGELINRQGLLSSEGRSSVKVASLDNRQGSLSSAGSVSVTSLGALDNQGGQLVTDTSLTLQSLSLDNRHAGTLSSAGPLKIVTGAFDNSHGGNVSSRDTLDIHAEQLTNQDGGELTSNQALSATVSGLEQQGGKLSSQTSVDLDLNHGRLNSQGGLINGPLLSLKNLKEVNNQDGEISSAQAFTLTAESLDNTGGKVLGNQGLTLRIAQVLSNLKGLIAAQSIDARAASLDNDAGTLTSRSDLLLNIDGQLSNRQQGLIDASTTLTLNSHGLDNHRGSLSGAAVAIDLGQATGDLSNQNGFIKSSGPLSIQHLRDLHNLGGEISTTENLSLVARTLDNNGGKLISHQSLILDANQLSNQGGLISGWQGVEIKGIDLDNRNNGTVSSRYGNVDARLANSLLNRGGGALVSQQALSVTAASIDNSDHGALSSAAGQTLNVSGLLSNAQGGLIDSGAALGLNVQTLDNTSGTINTQQALSLIGTRFDNSNGMLISKGAVTLDLLGALINNQGKLGSAESLLLKRATQINNQGGELASEGWLNLLAGSLDNRNHGAIVANHKLTLATEGAVQNSDAGLIHSQNAELQLQAASLDNGKGSIQSKTGLNLDISGDLDNQSGTVIAEAGDLDIKASTIDNRGGTLSSLKGILQAKALGGWLRNDLDLHNNRQVGVIQAQALNLVSAGINNNGGRLSAQTGDVLISTGAFDNRDGGLYAKQAVRVSASSFDNSGDVRGQVAGSQIDLKLSGALNNQKGVIESDHALTIDAASVDNRRGQLRALGTSGKTEFQIGGVFDSRAGTLETANSDLSLNVGSFLNEGGSVLHAGSGTFDISTDNLTRAGGTFVTRGALTLNTDTWTNSSVIQAGRLTVNVNTLNQTAGGQLLASESLVGTGQNWSNDGLIASDGSLSLSLGGAYSGGGRASSLGTLGLSAAQVNLASAGSLAGGDTTTINVNGLLNNAGRLTSAADLMIEAGTISNHGSLGSSQVFKAVTENLQNIDGFVFSGSNMNLYVGSLTNKNSDIYSLGSIYIAKNERNARAALLENISGVIESVGDLSVFSDTVVNKRDNFYADSKLESGYVGVRCYECNGFYDITKGSGGPRSHFVLVETYGEKSIVGKEPRQAGLVSGSHISVFGGDVVNSNSLISAGGDVSIRSESFSNIGTSLSGYKSVKYLNLNASNKALWAEALTYNSINDPTYNGGVHFWNAAGSETMAPIRIAITNRAKGEQAKAWQIFGSAWVYIGGLVGHLDRALPIPSGRYVNGVSSEASAVFKGADVTFEKIVADTGSKFISSIVQAGGGVSIAATERVSNGVERSFTQSVSGDFRSVDTKVGKSVAPVVVLLNKQLTPDLAQQQINPLTLPGFNLPSGQNGLFRLSQQDGSAAVPQAPSNWSMSSALVSLKKHQSALPATVRETQIDASTLALASTPELLQSDHKSIDIFADGATTNVTVPVSDVAGRISLMDLQQIDPAGNQVTSLGSQSLNRVQGLPDSSIRSQPHKYLIETNPALTDLKQFMSSDYLLSNLGYNPEESAKRLGDGFYEQRLIQQAVVARTGQRFINGQNSDEQLFKYLMDNAIKSKDSLSLSVGVSLTSEQVAALTHDIVWLEKAEVNGEQVLVPVLYLAQTNNRLAPNGALIAGNDLNLIAGKNLENAGTLRATNNLSAQAGQHLINSSLVESGNRLDLLAGNTLVNKAGGIIAGRDVSVTATQGDVINERTSTRLESQSGRSHNQNDVMDSAARIEAANTLSLQAGRDISNIGSSLKSGSDLSLKAGRDINVASVEQLNLEQTQRNLNKTITQFGSTVGAGRDLKVEAGRDITTIASTIEAERDITMSATENLTLASAADEQHSYSKSKKVTRQEDHIRQVGASVAAGGNVAISAGKDLTLLGSKVKGEQNVALDATRDLNLLSAKDESASFYSKKSKGSLGRSSSKQQESYHSTNIASVVEAGKDLTLNTSKKADGGMSINGGRDVTVIGSQLKAGADLMVGATGDVAILSGVEEHGSYSKKTKSGFLGLSKSGKSQLQTTATQVGSELSAGNDVVVAAGNDIRLRASEATAGNDVELRAGLVKDTGDINLVSANDTAYSRSEQYKKKVGLSSSGASVSFASAKESGRQAQSSTSVGSQVLAERDASLKAERDINVVGSGISAGRNVSLDAGRDVNVVAAQNSSAEQDWKKSKQVGVGVSSDDNGVSFFAGAERNKEKNRVEIQTAAASQISAGADLSVNAKRDINQIGSDLRADHDINLVAGRDIKIDAAREVRVTEQQRESERNGLGVTINHNYGKTKDAVNGAGDGENNTSKASSTLKAVDSVSQFLAGPTADVKLGNSRQSSSQEIIEQSNRSSTLQAGNDLNLTANNDVTVKGSQLGAGRDINIKGRDVTLDVAKGSISEETRNTEMWGGIHGGTSGGFKIGVGGSFGTASTESSQGSSTATQLDAGRDINLKASNDLNLIGTQAQAGRNIDLDAGNDLNIRAAQNDHSSENNRNSGGGEVGITVGTEKGIGFYASVSLGKGDLEREGERHQEAYLYAGDRLGFTSGKDTTIAGGNLRGDEVIGRVGGDLNVASVADTGKVKGKEFDISVTATIGPGAGVSGSVGYGQTTGKTNWVEEQTRITGKNKVDIRTENHTQIDGALIAADNGNLKLDTGTLGFSDIAGKDKEHGYYLNVGGTYSSGSGTTQDSSQVGKGKEGETGWSVSGWDYQKDREQIVRATVGAGEIVVRKDAETGADSTAGLNRDVNKAYEITKDEESRTDLYASSSSLGAVASPKKTYEQWKKSVELYGENSRDAMLKLDELMASMVVLLTAGSDIEFASRHVNNVLVIRENARKLVSKDENKRAEGMDYLIRAKVGEANGEGARLLFARMKDIARESPEKSLELAEMLASLKNPSNGSLNLAAAPGLGMMGALALALVYSGALPQTQENMRNTANSVVESAKEAGGVAKEEVQRQLKISMRFWELVTLTAFPIHLLDDENRKLVNPIVDTSGGIPASGGYAEGGGVVTTPHTGGTQLDGVQKDGAYVTPEHKLNPGGMYSESDSSKNTSKNLGSASFDAANGIGTIYSPKVSLSNGEIIFNDFSVGTSKGYFGYGPDGAAELVGPLKQMLNYAQSQGAEKITLKGRYATEEGAMLGTGSVDNVKQNFSFSFPATREGLKGFLKGLEK